MAVSEFASSIRKIDSFNVIKDLAVHRKEYQFVIERTERNVKYFLREHEGRNTVLCCDNRHVAR